MAIDAAAVYASAIRTPGLLPNAQIVVDHFHLVKLGNDALTKVRRRVTWEPRDHRGRKLDPKWANRRRLLRARERLSQSSFARMWNTIIGEDPSAQILSAWIANEELRTLLSTVRLGGDPHLTRQRPHRGLRPPRQTGQTCLPADSATQKLRPPDTIPLHRQTADSNPDFKLARSKSKTTYEARRGGTERGAGES